MEGPPLRVIAEELASFKDKRILACSGNSKIDKECLRDQKVTKVFSWGKNLFLQFSQFSLKIHFLMFGSYRVNEEKKGAVPRLSLVFSKATLNFYNCSVKLLGNAEVQLMCDDEIDIMSGKWSLKKVVGLMMNVRENLICDVLLDQKVFAGVGNIIKNETLFASKVHPMSIVGKVPKKDLEAVAQAAREFSKLFYDVVKKKKSLRPYLSIYGKKQCPDCGERVTVRYTGNLKRKSYFCEICQRLFA